MIKCEKGSFLIDVLVALLLIGIISVAFSGALVAASKATAVADERETARSLAESQMEYLKSLPYSTSSYTTQDTSALYPGFSAVTVTPPAQVYPGNDGIQMITIEVWHGTKLVLTLQGYKLR